MAATVGLFQYRRYLTNEEVSQRYTTDDWPENCLESSHEISLRLDIRSPWNRHRGVDSNEPLLVKEIAGAR